jgi:hypothetical protein
MRRVFVGLEDQIDSYLESFTIKVIASFIDPTFFA